MTPSLSIALVEDNDDVRDELVFNLSSRGMTVGAFASAEDFLAALDTAASWSVVVLDIGLPGMDGYQLANWLRKIAPRLGIVMLTARSATYDRIRGLSEGADAYLGKPVDMDELAATINAVARRLTAFAPEEKSKGVWHLDCRQSQLTSPDGERFWLSYHEAAFMRLLALASGDPVDRESLIMGIGKDPSSFDPRALEVGISRLRRKIGGKGSPLRSARGRGYQFVAEVSISNCNNSWA